MVLGPDKARLSKRHGAMSVSEYRDMGYLPDAVINYLVRLGWSHGDQEFFTRKELIEKFDLEHLGRSAGMFDISKMTALNAKHIQAKSASDWFLLCCPTCGALASMPRMMIFPQSRGNPPAPEQNPEGHGTGRPVLLCGYAGNG